MCPAHQHGVHSNPIAPLSEEEVAMAFLWPWELQTERVVTLDDFAERYEWVSAYIESDVMFGHMMHVLWDLA